jgi:hypothetical protein
MYIQVTDWKFVPTSEQQAERGFALAAEELLRQRPGCRSVLSFGDERDLYTLSAWESRTEAEAAGEALNAFMQAEGFIWWEAMTAPPLVRVFQSLES